MVHGISLQPSVLYNNTGQTGLVLRLIPSLSMLRAGPGRVLLPDDNHGPSIVSCMHAMAIKITSYLSIIIACCG